MIYILLNRWIVCMCWLCHIRVRVGSVFCLRGNVCLVLRRHAYCLFVYRLIGGVGSRIVCCRSCGVRLVGSSSWLGRMRSGVQNDVFCLRTTVRNCRLVVTLAIPNILRG